MKNRGTYTLLALFFASLIGLWAADFAQIPTQSQRQRMSSRILPALLDTKPDDLQKIEIIGGDEPIVFERRAGNAWQMTSPMNVAADPSKVETLAYNLKELTRRPEADTLEGDPATFGLVPPEKVVRLWGTSTKAPIASLDLGKISVDRRYVRASGTDGFEVVDAKGLNLLTLPTKRWRDQELFRVPSFEVDAIRVSSGGKDLKFKRSREGWHILSPYKVPAAEARVDGLIADLGSLRVLDESRFIANDVKDADFDRYGLKNPTMTIEVEAGRVARRQTKQVLHVGKVVEGKENLIYVRRSDQNDIVAVESRILKEIRPDPNAYRSPKVADVNVARVIRIEVESADGNGFEVARTVNGWTILRPSPAIADTKAIQDFLKSLDQLQTSTYLPTQMAAELGLEKPLTILKIWEARDPRDTSDQGSADPNGVLAMTLQIGRRDIPRKSIYARIEGDPNILALPDSAHEFLPRDSLAFRDRRLLSVATDKIERLKFEGIGRKITLNAPILKHMPMIKAPMGWWVVEPVSAPADSKSVGQLFKMLINLRAESYVAENAPDLDQFGLKTPALTFTWSTVPSFSMVSKPSGSGVTTFPLEDHTLLVGSAVPTKPNLRYAKLGDRPIIFTLGPDMLRALDAEWHDHRIFSFDSKQVRKVQLDWPDRDLALNLVDDGSNRKWTLQGTVDGSTLDPSRLMPLLEAASKLETPRFAQYTGDFPTDNGLTPPRLTIRFDLGDGSPTRTLKIGDQAGPDSRLATTSPDSQGAVFVVPEAVFGPWTKLPRRHDDLPDNVFAP